MTGDWLKKACTYLRYLFRHLKPKITTKLISLHDDNTSKNKRKTKNRGKVIYSSTIPADAVFLWFQGSTKVILKM